MRHLQHGRPRVDERFKGREERIMHYAQIIAGLFLLSSVFANEAWSGTIPLPGPGACNVVKVEADYVGKSGTGYSYDISKYGGDGCEVMLDVQAELFTGPKAGPVSGWEVGGSYSYNHQVRLESPLPSGVAMPAKVPILFTIRIDGSISGGSGYFFNLVSTVNGVGYGSEYPVDTPFEYSRAFTSLVAPNTSFSSFVKGYITLNVNGGGAHAYGQLIVDPFIVVDPTYAYAPHFGVYQQKAGVWREVHRDWLPTPVPEPETWGMFLVGLGMISVAAERRKANRD